MLGIGRKDQPSYGVEDQFSKSHYDPAHPCPVEGLADVLQRTRPTQSTPQNSYIRTLTDEYQDRKLERLNNSQIPNPLRPIPGIGREEHHGLVSRVTSNTSHGVSPRSFSGYKRAEMERLREIQEVKALR